MSKKREHWHPSNVEHADGAEQEFAEASNETQAGNTEQQHDAGSSDNERSELVGHLQRLQAEFDNYRKRTAREQEELKDTGNDKLLRDILPIIDNLDLALQHAKDNDGNVRGDELLTGIVMIQEQLHQLLSHYGVEPLESDGEKFSPEKHEALITVEQEGTPKGTVVQTFQRGFRRNSKVLRHAKVSVAK